MPRYTYRYSKTPSCTVSAYCPVCCKKTLYTEVELAQPDVRLTPKGEMKSYAPSKLLCCSEECTTAYKTRIVALMMWVYDRTTPTGFDAQIARRGLLPTYTARKLAEVSEYLPDALKRF